MTKIADRIAARRGQRLAALKVAIDERGIKAAEDYARSLLSNSEPKSQEIQEALALASLAFAAESNLHLSDAKIDAVLRRICAKAMIAGSALSPALRKFAADAIVREPTRKKRGRPSNQWKMIVARQVVEDLREIGFPAYHGAGQDTDAQFYGVDVVGSAFNLKERTVREWWRNRHTA